MGDSWIDPIHYVRGYNAQEGTLMDLGRQLMQRGTGESVWSAGGLGNWQSSRPNRMAGEHNFGAEDTVMRSFETGPLFGVTSTPLSDMTNPRQYQTGGLKQQQQQQQLLLRETLNCHTGVHNVENAKPRVVGSSVLDGCVPSRDPNYGMEFSLTTCEADMKFQLERELEFHRREAERRVWRNNFEAIPQVRMSSGPNSVISSEQNLSNSYVSRGLSTALDRSLPSQLKMGNDYTSRISAAVGGNSGIASEQQQNSKYSSRHSATLGIHGDIAVQAHAGMVHAPRVPDRAAPNNAYVPGGPVGVGQQNCSISAQLNSNSALGYSDRIMETSSSTGYGSQSCEMAADITSVVPSLTYELPDFHSAAFGYSTPVYEERVATNDSTSEPMDCLMGDFQADVVPDAMSPAIAPMFKRTNWDIVNDGFDLLSHGTCPEASGGFPWQSDVLVGDMCHTGHSAINSTSSFLLPTTPKLSSSLELSPASALDEQTMQEFSLVTKVLSFPSNRPSSTGISRDHERKGVVGAETISAQGQGGRDSAEKVERIKEESSERKAVVIKEEVSEPAPISKGERGSVEKMDSSMTMMTRIMRFAETIDSKDDKVALHQRSSALKSAQEFCSVDGDYTQRVAHYFCEALSRRVESRENGNAAAVQEEPYQLPHDLLEDCKFTEACPYTKFVHLTANQAFLEAVEGAESVHIIDFGTMQGVQWSALIQALVSPAGPNAAAPPKKIRITGVASTKLGPNASEYLLRTGRRLTEFAESMGLQIEFLPILEEVQNLDHTSFQIREGEVVAVNLMLQLHQHSGEEGGKRLPKILKLVQSLKPKVVVLVEYEAAVNTETSDPQTRLLDAMKHYCAVFQTLEEAMPQNCLERTRIERDILGREIRKMFTSTSDKNSMKHASFAQWKDLFTGLGFQAVKPSHYSFSQARLLLWMYEGPYQILNNPQSISLSWHDRVLITVSAWHCL
ncbi:DELLA protein [Marchantia polymorpha subsp. ruderalis]|nr:hypothetical protein MARPO_0047s0034 [Marchantia polymorpha]BBN14712.1 hypothetical protein Mp_6g13820 [Marchantia polymorpha subsp. ruderalis]|eukprot:PTQ39051.1 hypothetical protein MARPO_0047s0034 [Marchantia polymorpha]